MRKGERPGEGVKVQLQCELCGKGFERYASRVKRPGQGRFCSSECQRKGTTPERKRFGEAHAHWRGGSGSYRDRALRAYGEACQICGYDRFRELLWVHHKDFSSRPKQHDHSLENLEVLCIRCHLEKHIEAEGGLRNSALRQSGAESVDVSKSSSDGPQMGASNPQILEASRPRLW